MINRILDHFPPRTYALTLVSDPDNLLADEQLLTALAERGFSLITETDPVWLRYEIEGKRPFSPHHPLIIVTNGELKALPYDLWQQGYQVSLALHAFFPRLAYPIIRELSSEQRWRLSQAPEPPSVLGQRATMAYLLGHVFAADLEALQQPAHLIAWLNQYHQQMDALPPKLADYLLATLQSLAAYATWPLETLLHERSAFRQFVTGQWGAYVQSEMGEQLLREPAANYVLSFAEDVGLQDVVSALVRAGTLEPAPVTRPEQLPAWAKTAVLAPDENADEKRAEELLGLLEEQFAGIEQARWFQWQLIARTWAELTNLRYAGVGQFGKLPYQEWQLKLDAAFPHWLQQRYASLGVKRLPTPHHLYHVPHYLAARREHSRNPRVALIVLDGMSLADWWLIRQAWAGRHAEWQMQEMSLLAQVPAITAVSRQSLISGLRPADFGDSLSHNRHEAKQWAAFWAQKGVAAKACGYGRLRLGVHALPTELSSWRMQAICLVNNSIDDMLHGASLGAAGVQASLRLWLDEQSPQLESAISGLLERGFSVTMTSDHGHTEAQGVGRPSEGLTVQTRSKRARIYRDESAALAVQRDYPDTILWHGHGLLPDDAWVLVGNGRNAFTPKNEVVVTHGGLTLDEMVVPLIQISPVA